MSQHAVVNENSALVGMKKLLKRLERLIARDLEGREAFIRYNQYLSSPLHGAGFAVRPRDVVDELVSEEKTIATKERVSGTQALASRSRTHQGSTFLYTLHCRLRLVK